MKIKYSQVFIKHLRLILFEYGYSSVTMLTCATHIFLGVSADLTCCLFHVSKTFLCPGSDNGSSSNKSGRWNVSKVYCQEMVEFTGVEMHLSIKTLKEELREEY